MHVGNVMISVFLATLMALVSPGVARTAMADCAAGVPGAVLPMGEDLDGAELLDAQGESWRVFVMFNAKAVYLFFLYKALDAAWAQVRSQPRVSGSAFNNGHVGGGQGGGGGGTW